MSEEEATPRPNPIRKTGPRPTYDASLDEARTLLNYVGMWNGVQLDFGIRPAYCADAEQLPIPEIKARIAWAKAWERADDDGRTEHADMLDQDLLENMEEENLSRRDVFFLSMIAWREHIPIPPQFFTDYKPTIRR